jgi:hypothetical protein
MYQIPIRFPVFLLQIVSRSINLQSRTVRSINSALITDTIDTQNGSKCSQMSCKCLAAVTTNIILTVFRNVTPYVWVDSYQYLGLIISSTFLPWRWRQGVLRFSWWWLWRFLSFFFIPHSLEDTSDDTTSLYLFLICPCPSLSTTPWRRMEE